MSWRRQRCDTRDKVVREPDEQYAIEAAWTYLVEEEGVANDGLERRCNELGALGWELVGVLPLSRLAFSSGGRTTGTQLFFKRRLP